MKAADFKIVIAEERHFEYIETILSTIEEAAKVRGTGIARRKPEYLQLKMKEGKAVIALYGKEEEFAGFSYIETWQDKKYVTTSGLIVAPKFQGMGIARKIKHMTFSLARKRWPEAKIFSLMSGKPVMKLNTALGFLPVTFSDLTEDDEFWKGCEGCINYDILKRTERKYCICTGMLFDPKNKASNEAAKHELKASEKKPGIAHRFLNNLKKN